MRHADAESCTKVSLSEKTVHRRASSLQRARWKDVKAYIFPKRNATRGAYVHDNRTAIVVLLSFFNIVINMRTLRKTNVNVKSQNDRLNMPFSDTVISSSCRADIRRWNSYEMSCLRCRPHDLRVSCRNQLSS